MAKVQFDLHPTKPDAEHEQSSERLICMKAFQPMDRAIPLAKKPPINKSQHAYLTERTIRPSP
jgi:hypothetical protein